MVEYAGKLCLAPMVRSGELPTRIMALRHGADLVWTPELVDKKIIQCHRIANPALGTIDYIDSNFKVDTSKPKHKNKKPPIIFRTFPPLERGKLIFQIGSANPDLAVEAAQKVIDDVDGIDLNCGCPKPFSTHSGMGAALLSTPDLLTDILRNLVEKVGTPHNKPISCKIRLMDETDPQPTINLVEKICATGIENITIHCRTRAMRNRELPVRTVLPPIIDFIHSKNVSVVVNGNIQSRRDFGELQKTLGLTVGGMIAESAETNPSVFGEPLPWNKTVEEFCKTAIEFDNHVSNTKYVLLNQVPGKSPYYKKFCQLKTNEEFLELAQSIDDECPVMVKNCQKDVFLTKPTPKHLIASDLPQAKRLHA